METIKSYLEAMFASMPNTTEVRKAKSELLQMMEDKYNELIADGQSENAAVGTVISEFGNLDELADDLGLKEAVEEAKGKEVEAPRRHVILEEVQDFLSCRTKKALFLALGVLLCIISPTLPIMFDAGNLENVGAAMMFVVVALGVGSIVFSSFLDADWKFLEKELCRIDINTANYVKEKRKSFESVRALCITIGVVLCVICWVPCIVSPGNIGPIMLFVLVGIGVFLIVYANKISSGFDMLMRLNDVETISGNYIMPEQKPVKYKNKTAETIVAVYWPTVTCLYLIISFLTFQWHLTWIIWPIAGVAHRAVVINCREDEF
ncbi:MAG: permease prefix domain 1-containing protein [Lachnospiraceae bacterium]|nr:permease prefix domain 1-containing protein [Lachnospiraceae bacterium]